MVDDLVAIATAELSVRHAPSGDDEPGPHDRGDDELTSEPHRSLPFESLGPGPAGRWTSAPYSRSARPGPAVRGTVGSR